jgi:hypothetical protein
MDTYTKNTASKTTKAYGPKAFRDLAEIGTTQAKDAVDK